MTTEDTDSTQPERKPVTTRATIQAGAWVPVCVDIDGRTIDAYNPGDEAIELEFTDEPDSTGRVPSQGRYPLAGWRARHREYNPITDGALPGAEHGQRRWVAELESRAATLRHEHDQRTARNLAAGNIEVTSQDPDGTTHYRVTETGARHVEHLLGLPPNTVPFGDSLLDR